MSNNFNAVFGPAEFESWASSKVVPRGWPLELCREAWIAAIESEREKAANAAARNGDHTSAMLIRGNPTGGPL